MNIDSDIYQAFGIILLVTLGYMIVVSLVSALTVHLLARKKEKRSDERRELLTLAGVRYMFAMLGVGAYASFSTVGNLAFDPTVYFFAPAFVVTAEILRYSTKAIVRFHDAP